MLPHAAHLEDITTKMTTIVVVKMSSGRREQLQDDTMAVSTMLVLMMLVAGGRRAQGSTGAEHSWEGGRDIQRRGASQEIHRHQQGID